MTATAASMAEVTAPSTMELEPTGLILGISQNQPVLASFGCVQSA